MALPSAKFSLISTKTTSEAKFLMAMYSAQLAPTAPAPTTKLNQAFSKCYFHFM